MHVRGFKEEGTTTTPFDMCVRNDIHRFHPFSNVVDRVPHLRCRPAYVHQFVRDKLVDHREFIQANGDDPPEIRDWTWPY